MSDILKITSVLEFVQYFVLLLVLSQILALIVSVIFPSSERKKLHSSSSSELSNIDVIVPIRSVDPSVLELTLKGIRDSDYPQELITLVIGDDTPNIKLSEIYSKLATTYKARYIYLPENKKYKAGMVNYCLQDLDSPLVCLLDYDQIPTTNFFKICIRGIQDEDDIAFVQLIKRFRDLKSIFNKWSALLYLQFFEAMQRTKNERGTVLFAGSTGCFRREYLNEVGLFSEETFTEDADTSIKLILKGYRGLYLDSVGSYGTVPKNYQDQIAQLWRWSHGGSHSLSLRGTLILRSKEINLSQKIDLLATIGITPLLVLIYVYTLAVAVLVNFRLDYQSPILLPSSRYSVSIAGILPLLAITTYLLVVSLAYYEARKDPELEKIFKWRYLPIFTLIGISSNVLILSSGITGFLRILGPNSRYGTWNRKFNIWLESGILAIIGILGIYFSILISDNSNWLFICLISVSFVVPIIVTILSSLHLKFKNEVSNSLDTKQHNF